MRYLLGSHGFRMRWESMVRGPIYDTISYNAIQDSKDPLSKNNPAKRLDILQTIYCTCLTTLPKHQNLSKHNNSGGYKVSHFTQTPIRIWNKTQRRQKPQLFRCRENTSWIESALTQDQEQDKNCQDGDERRVA